MGKGVGEMRNHHVLGSILEVEIKNRQARVQPQELSVLSDSVRKCHIASVLDGTKTQLQWGTPFLGILIAFKERNMSGTHTH